MRVATPSSPGSTSGESLSATELEDSDTAGAAGQRTTTGRAGTASLVQQTGAGTSRMTGMEMMGGARSFGGAGDVAGVSGSTILARRRHHHHHHSAHHSGTGAAKVGHSITDSAGSTEDEREDGMEDNELEDNDDGGRPVIHYPALATPTASKASFWPFGTTDDPANASGMIDGPDYRHRLSSDRQSLPQPSNKAAAVVANVGGATSTPLLAMEEHATPINRSNAANLPHEILLKVLSHVRSHADLVSSLLVCKSWCQCGVELLWNKLSFPSVQPLIKMLVVLHRQATNTFPYSSFIKRLNFSSLADRMSDALIMKLNVCDRLERLTLAGCTDIGDTSLVELVKTCRNLIALDLSDCTKVTDLTLQAVARECPKLQGLNLSGCKGVGDTGLKAIAAGCPRLRRVRSQVRSVDDMPDSLLAPGQATHAGSAN